MFSDKDRPYVWLCRSKMIGYYKNGVGPTYILCLQCGERDLEHMYYANVEAKRVGYLSHICKSCLRDLEIITALSS